MKKSILLGVIIIFLITLLGTGTAMAIGPYKAIDKNPNLYDLSGRWPTALVLKTNPDGDFVQWYKDRHYIFQCTDCMNPDAIESKLSEGWTLWSPADKSYIRYDWCSGNEYIRKMIIPE